MANQMKTPGVYIVEKNAFPNSVVEVATAVPAFIGYTSQAKEGTKDLTMVPTRITSMLEYEKYFGTAPDIQFSIKGSTVPVPVEGSTDKASSSNIINQVFTIDNDKFEVEITNPLHTLYYHLKFFYLNGGGLCYIVSVGDGKQTDSDLLVKGLLPLRMEMEPTMIIIPEAVNCETAECKTIQEQMITECSALQNRVAILDVSFVSPASSYEIDNTINNFRSINTGETPSYAVAYFPWLQTNILSERNLSADKIEAASLSKELKSLIDKQDTITRHNTLMQNWEPYKKLFHSILEKANTFPPSAAIAGIYTIVDNARGVWKAPANVSVNAVTRPVINIDDERQSELNISMTGKAINAIRTFQGEGIKIWGARTLDGNSMDWRYINVRRTMIYLEQSIKNAARAYVFEPNTANTWINMKGMMDSFLRSVWKRGGLAGATPEDAYSIHVGLGDTMTPEDILDGILRITIQVAISHPAEFIEITFQQQMQKS